jgi:hypothetical protein
MPSLHRAPDGIVGAFIGWERLMSIMSCVERAADLQLFPRLDATGGPSLPWAETNIRIVDGFIVPAPTSMLNGCVMAQPRDDQ